MLNASLVLYCPDLSELTQVVDTLLRSPIVKKVFLVDNSPQPLTSALVQQERVQYIFLGKNVGYGRAHNVALRISLADVSVAYHLVLNSDILFSPTLLQNLEKYMQQHPFVGSLMPRVVYPDGSLQYLCKRLPSPFDLFGRRFLPQRWMQRRMAWYEMRETGYDKPMDVPYLSGCFMFLRVEALRQVGLFDERFFMYPEDIDLTRRLHAQYSTVYYPYQTIVHAHRAASYKSLRYLWVHIWNICRYFCKWGWFFDAERCRFNQASPFDSRLSVRE